MIKDMKTKKNKEVFVNGKVLVLMALLTFHFSLFTAMAQDAKSQFRPIDHAVISQTIAPDARSAGMGDIGAATDPDVNSQYWNSVSARLVWH